MFVEAANMFVDEHFWVVDEHFWAVDELFLRSTNFLCAMEFVKKLSKKFTTFSEKTIKF